MTSKKGFISRARIAKKLQRYDDMYLAMRSVSQSGETLNKKERNLFYLAYQYILKPYRSGWYKLLVITELIDGSRRKMELTKEYKEHVERQWMEYCSEAINTIDSILMPRVTLNSPKIFYLKMRGDLTRYMIEISVGARRKRLIRETKASYQEAAELSDDKLSPIHPLRLTVALNYSVFYGHSMDKKDMAISTAQTALTGAEKLLDKIQDKKRLRKITNILQLLRDNIAYWTPVEIESAYEGRGRDELMKDDGTDESGSPSATAGGAGVEYGGRHGGYPSPTLVEEYEADEGVDDAATKQDVEIEPYVPPPESEGAGTDLEDISSSDDELDEEEGEEMELEELDSDSGVQGPKEEERVILPPGGLIPYEFSASEADFFYQKVLEEQEMLAQISASKTRHEAEIIRDGSRADVDRSKEAGGAGDEAQFSSDESSSDDGRKSLGRDEDFFLEDDNLGEYSEERIVEQILDDYFKFDVAALKIPSSSSESSSDEYYSSSSSERSLSESSGSSSTAVCSVSSDYSVTGSIRGSILPAASEQIVVEAKSTLETMGEEELGLEEADEIAEQEEIEQGESETLLQEEEDVLEVEEGSEEGDDEAAAEELEEAMPSQLALAGSDEQMIDEDEEGEDNGKELLEGEEDLESTESGENLESAAASTPTLASGEAEEVEVELKQIESLGEVQSIVASSIDIASAEEETEGSLSDGSSYSSSSSYSSTSSSSASSKEKSPMFEGEYFHPLPPGPKSALDSKTYTDEFTEVVKEVDSKLAHFQFSEERFAEIDRVLEFLEDQEERKAIAESEGRRFEVGDMNVSDPLVKLMFTEFRISYPEFDKDVLGGDAEEESSVGEDSEDDERDKENGDEGEEGEEQLEEGEDQLTRNEVEDKAEIACLIEFPYEFAEYENTSFKKEYIKVKQESDEEDEEDEEEEEEEEEEGYEGEEEEEGENGEEEVQEEDKMIKVEKLETTAPSKLLVKDTASKINAKTKSKTAKKLQKK